MAAVDLYWLPLGAVGHFVRLNGRLHEALAAPLERRPARDLHHSALQVEVPKGMFVVEQTPVHDRSGEERGVVAEGAAAARWAGRFRPAATRAAPLRRAARPGDHTSDDLVSWIRKLRSAGYVPHSVHESWGTLHLVLTHAVRWEALAASPAER